MLHIYFFIDEVKHYAFEIHVNSDIHVCYYFVCYHISICVGGINFSGQTLEAILFKVLPGMEQI